MATPRLRKVAEEVIPQCAQSLNVKEDISELVEFSLQAMVQQIASSLENFLLVPPEKWADTGLPEDIFFGMHSYVYRNYPNAPRPQVPFFGLKPSQKTANTPDRRNSIPQQKPVQTPTVSEQTPTCRIKYDRLQGSPGRATSSRSVPDARPSLLVSAETGTRMENNRMAETGTRMENNSHKNSVDKERESFLARTSQRVKAGEKGRERPQPAPATGTETNIPGGLFRTASSLLGKRNRSSECADPGGGGTKEAKMEPKQGKQDDRAKPKEEKEEDEMETKILKDILCARPGVSFHDIVGLDGPKESLRQMIILPLLNPEIYTGLREPPRGLLMFGPGGNGKTFIAKAVASECVNVTFFNLSAASLTSKWLGESEKLMRALFTVAKRKAPSLIFIDEIDSILSKRGEADNDASRRLKTEFLVQFDGVTSEDGAQVIFLAATNRPWDLDEAALRRFTERFYVPLPTMEARLALIRKLIQSEDHCLSEEDIQDLVNRTDGYAAFEVQGVCRRAAQQQMRELSFDIARTINKQQLRPLCAADFQKAIKVVRAANSNEAIEQHRLWNKQYGAQD